MKAPHFWSGGLDPRAREAAPLTRVLLTPVAALYGAIVARKLAHANPAKVGIPVICVGNLTVGGSGKTPIVAAIRQHLQASGLRAASLSRGYKGRLKGPLRVDPGVHTAADVGDEPLMLASHGESWIGADRVAAARAMEAAGAEIIIMDDGHQNPSLHRNLSLVVVDAGDPFGNGHVFPKGPLREPVKAGLGRADAVILAGDGPDPDGRWPCPVVRARLEPVAPPPDGPLVAFAGIGRPQKVFDSLSAAGATLVDTVPYPDHHPYSRGDLKWLEALAAERDARLITTEKDAARLPADVRDPVAVWPVRAVFEPADALDGWLQAVVEQRSHG
ncbi:MAG: tetraacyldisaccharide 4'-kinase [Pseudomonadota bacterium]